MKKHGDIREFEYTTAVVFVPVLFVLFIWVVYWIEVRFGFNLNFLGVFPRKVAGLPGIFFSPFIHSGISHLYHNSIPLLVLTASTFYFYRSIAWKVIVYGILLSGLLTWIIGRPSYHIGASGLIYVLVSFIFFKGVFTGYYRLVALSLLMVFLYGSMIWYTLPVDESISWEGHLAGFVTGFVFALIFKKNLAKPQKYKWEEEDYNEAEDEFMKHFDENGNFIEKLPEDPLENSADQIKITYTFREKKD